MIEINSSQDELEQSTVSIGGFEVTCAVLPASGGILVLGTLKNPSAGFADGYRRLSAENGEQRPPGALKKYPG